MLLYLLAGEVIHGDRILKQGVVARDYREAVKGTPFDVEQQRQQWGYKRQTERELLVERKVVKFRILAENSVNSTKNQ